MSRSWLLISVLVAILCLGFQGIITLFLCIIGLGLGFILVLYGIHLSKIGFIHGLKNSRQFWKRPVLITFRPEAVATNTDCLTGYQIIDEEIDHILTYILRDYVHIWYRNLSHTDEFISRIKDVFEFAIAKLSAKVISVDWVPFLTTRLVNDAAKHLHLFKRARQELRLKSNSKLSSDLESIFFDAEAGCSDNICRDLVCTIEQDEISYLQDISEIILFMILPGKDFKSNSLRTLTREILTNLVFKPILDLVSDPDFINQQIVWLYKDYPIKPELLTITIRNSECIEELEATRDSVSHEISVLRSNDSRFEVDSSLKQQLNSLISLRKTIDTRIHRLQSGSETDSIGIPAQVDWNQLIGPGLKLFDLPIEVILKNNLALSYFSDYMNSIGCRAYIYFYLNVEGWKASAEQQMNLIDLETQEQQNEDGSANKNKRDLESMREAAHTIYEEYLSDKASPRLKIDDSLVKMLLFKIRTESPNSEWFSDVQKAVFDKLQSDERFLISFKRSMGYVKLLAELDLIKDAATTKSDEDETQSLGEEYSIYDNLSLNSNEELSETDGDTTLVNKSSSGLDMKTPSNSNVSGFNTHRRMGSDSLRPIHKTPQRNASHGSLNLFSDLDEDLSISSGITPNEVTAKIEKYVCMNDSGKSYAIYKIFVTLWEMDTNKMKTYHVYRRYSDFHTLHETISSQFPKLSKLAFPKKKAFGNMESNVLDIRLKMLHQYLQELLKPEVIKKYPDILDMIKKFLDNTYEIERSNQTSNVAKAVGTVKNSVKTVSNAVTSVKLVDNVVDGITKVLTSKQIDSDLLDFKSTAFLGNETESTDNIPLRLALLFMDEVFDLKEKNQWLRRQITAMLRQIFKAMFGDWANRRIVEYFSQLTSPQTLASYLRSFKNSKWPNGFPAGSYPIRDESAKMRTRVAAKMALLSSISDDLKRIIGSETSQSGILTLFNMLQHPVLNRRLAIVIFESILDTIFCDQNFPSIFTKLHSRSPRIRNELKISQRKQSDLRR